MRDAYQSDSLGIDIAQVFWSDIPTGIGQESRHAAIDLERPATLSAEYAWSQTDAAEAPPEAIGLIESLERLLAARLS
jgi:hypothetical protein